ncbi:MAG: flagellar biosynthetic protein FliO [Deltaproteobacteria bacterium]|nr:flagellar biosynthetic protein FliO [Deltaproteobacteria bacterium]
MSRRMAGAAAILLTVAVILVAAPAKADPPDAGIPSWLSQNQPVEAAPAGSLPVGRMIVLLVVTAGIGGGAWYVRKRKLSKAGLSQNKKLQLVDSTRVGPKAELVIASVQGRMMLLGVTETNIRRLAWLDEQAPAEAAAPADSSPPAQSPDSFTAMLRSLVDTDSAPGNEDREDIPRAQPAARAAFGNRDTVRQLPAQQVTDSVEGQAAGLTRRSRRRA